MKLTTIMILLALAATAKDKKEKAPEFPAKISDATLLKLYQAAANMQEIITEYQQKIQPRLVEIQARKKALEAEACKAGGFPEGCTVDLSKGEVSAAKVEEKK